MALGWIDGEKKNQRRAAGPSAGEIMAGSRAERQGEKCVWGGWVCLTVGEKRGPVLSARCF